MTLQELEATIPTMQEWEADLRQRGILTREAIAAEFIEKGVCPICGGTGRMVEKVSTHFAPMGYVYVRCSHYSMKARNIWALARHPDHFLSVLHRRLFFHQRN